VRRDHGFSFGRNWQSFLSTVDEESIRRALADIDAWLGSDGVAGKTVVDIGSGSGLHSLCFQCAGASRVLSVDVDPLSVAATRAIRQRSKSPENWVVLERSILDEQWVARETPADIVYSWGVLHHTGDIWAALGNACRLVAPRGRLWITLYTKGSRYASDLALKTAYNAASSVGKTLMEWRFIFEMMRQRTLRGENPFSWNERRARGMTAYHDLVDWLGGLPYEVASVEETVAFCEARRLVPVRVDPVSEGGCSGYLFQNMSNGA
jgi:SAM-dependent methyltransferase